MLLRRSQGQRNVGKDELCARFDKFGAGQWVELLDEAQHSVASSHPNSTGGHNGTASRKVKVGEVSRARQCLTGATLAPSTEDTFHRMQSRRPQVETRALPQEVHDFQPDTPLTVDRKVFLHCLKSTPRGASPGPGRWHSRASEVSKTMTPSNFSWKQSRVWRGPASLWKSRGH